jgi:hypothetical protein
MCLTLTIERRRMDYHHDYGEQSRLRHARQPQI